MHTDLELLTGWRSGDLDAGEALFERYYAAVLRFFANKIHGDPADLVQDTFAACASGKHKVHETSSFRSYLFAVAHNILRAHYRSRRRESDRLDFTNATAADLSPGPGTMVCSNAEQRLLLEGLRRIPVEHQVLMELFYWEELTSAEIAEVIGAPHGTIRTRIRRARQLLEEAIRGIADGEDQLHATISDLDGWAKKVREQAALR